MAPNSSNNRMLSGMVLLLALLNVMVFGQTVNFPFISYDDPAFVYENETLRKGLSWETVKWCFTSTHTGLLIPLTWLSYFLDYRIHGLNAGGYHLTNLLFHTSSSILLFFFLWRSTHSLLPSALTSILFAIHPLHVESVAWISERKDVLSIFFVFLGLVFYQGYVGKLASRFSPWRYAAAFLCFIFAVLSKPTVVTFPFVLLLLDGWPLGRFRSEGGGLERAVKFSVLEKIPFILVTLAYSIFTFVSQRNLQSIYSLDQLPLSYRLSNALVSYVVYLKKTILPHDLALFYPLDYHQLSAWKVAGALILLCAISWFCIKKARPFPFLLMGWLWFLGTLVPMIGLVQSGSQAMADRYSYLSLTGIFISISWGVDAWRKRYPHHVKIIHLGLASAVLLYLLPMGWIQVGYWKHPVILFKRGLSVTGKNPILHECLAGFHMSQGNYSEAIHHLEESAKAGPPSPEYFHGMGSIQLRLGHYSNSITLFKAALERNPNHKPSLFDLGWVYLKLGDSVAAAEQFRKFVKLEPSNPNAVYALGIALFELGQYKEAQHYFERTLLLNPSSLEAKEKLKEALEGQRATTNPPTVH